MSVESNATKWKGKYFIEKVPQTFAILWIAQKDKQTNKLNKVENTVWAEYIDIAYCYKNYAT